MTNLTVHAIPRDRMWGCWGECISLLQQKALRQPLCPKMSYGCLCFFLLPITRTLLTTECTSKLVCKNDSGSRAAVSFGAFSGNDPILLPLAFSHRSRPEVYANCMTAWRGKAPKGLVGGPRAVESTQDRFTMTYQKKTFMFSKSFFFFTAVVLY